MKKKRSVVVLTFIERKQRVTLSTCRNAALRVFHEAPVARREDGRFITLFPEISEGQNVMVFPFNSTHFDAVLVHQETEGFKA